MQVVVRLNAPMDADEVRAFGADVVILATGSQPTGEGFQRALPHFDRLPGIERGNVCSAEEVMARQVRPGRRVVLLDEGANWKGAGTALALAEAGHELTIVTPAGMVAKEVERTAADIPIRKRLREKGARFFTDAAVREWRGDAAVITQFAGTDEVVAADTLVIAACNRSEDELARELEGDGLDIRTIGDAVAARTAVMAIYEGRKAAMEV
jgi:pyruvate/2-oxoglutarate dehydrogenase complex dihydrolipoamide dehydrogenase (E3) component